MQEIKLSAAGTTDIPVINELAAKIWQQHYPTIISQEQITYMLKKMYDPVSLKKQMEEQQHRFYFICEGEKRCGFLSVQEKPDREWFIPKFYIDQNYASKGFGSAAFVCLQKITNARLFRLAVNRKNYSAINFYFKNGFTIERIADVDIGEGFAMRDFIMKWEKK